MTSFCSKIQKPNHIGLVFDGFYRSGLVSLLILRPDFRTLESVNAKPILPHLDLLPELLRLPHDISGLRAQASPPFRLARFFKWLLYRLPVVIIILAVIVVVVVLDAGRQKTC